LVDDDAAFVDDDSADVAEECVGDGGGGVDALAVEGFAAVVATVWVIGASAGARAGRGGPVTRLAVCVGSVAGVGGGPAFEGGEVHDDVGHDLGARGARQGPCSTAAHFHEGIPTALAGGAGQVRYSDVVAFKTCFGLCPVEVELFVDETIA